MLSWYQPSLSFWALALMTGSAPVRVDRNANLTVEAAIRTITTTAMPSWRISDESMAVSRPGQSHGEALLGALPISKLMSPQTGDSYAPAIVTRDEIGCKPGRNGRHGSRPWSCRGKRDCQRGAGLHRRRRRSGLSDHASPHLPPRSHAHLSLLLQSRPPR